MEEKINERRNILVSDELWRRFKSLCALERKTTGEKVTELIERALERKPRREGE